MVRVGLALVAVLSAASVAMDEEDGMNSNVFAYLEQEAAPVMPQLAWNASDATEHETWRLTFRAKLVELLGRWPARVPLAVHWDEDDVLETDGFTRRKVYIRSEEHYWVPAYYYIPKGLEGKAPAMVCFHGHSGIMPYIREGTEAERDKGRAHALDYAAYFAEHGYISLAVVQRGWNETRNETPHSCHRVTMDSFLLGMTPVGLRTWDAMRVIDFLLTQDEVDPERIGTAGLSGGGTTALFLAAREPRIQLAMIAGYFCTFRDSIFTIHHCICNCVPGIMQWGEMSDVAALFAPRPMLIISGDEDRIFPIDATKRAYAELETTYAVLGAEERDQVDLGMLHKDIDRGDQFAVHAGRIGDEADPLAPDPLEVFFEEDFIAESDLHFSDRLGSFFTGIIPGSPSRFRPCLL